MNRCNVNGLSLGHHPLLHGKDFTSPGKYDVFEKEVQPKVDLNNLTYMTQKRGKISFFLYSVCV